MDSASRKDEIFLKRLAEFNRLSRASGYFRIFRACSYTIFFLSLCGFFFIISASPRNEVFFFLPLFSMPVALFFSVLFGFLLRAAEKNRNNLVRGFFMDGLRVDEMGNLITNTAHPSKVVDAAMMKLRGK